MDRQTKKNFATDLVQHLHPGGMQMFSYADLSYRCHVELYEAFSGTNPKHRVTTGDVASERIEIILQWAVQARSTLPGPHASLRSVLVSLHTTH